METKFFEHPIYTQLSPKWQIYQDLYEGEHSVLKTPRYLWPHEFEEDEIGGKKLRQIRERRTRYVNYMKPIINRYISLLFKDPPDISSVEKLFADGEIDDVDGKGTSLINYIKRDIAANYFLYGKIGVLVDAPPVAANSKAEEKQVGLRPYFETIDPQIIKDWDNQGNHPSRRGRYNFIRTEYQLLEPRQSPLNEPVTRLYTKIYATDGTTYTTSLYRGDEVNSNNKGDKSGKWEPQYTDMPVGDLSEIPIVILDDDSWVKDVSEVAQLQFNTQSSYDNQLLFQAFQKIFISGSFPNKGKMTINEGNLTIVPGDAKVTVVEPSNPVALANRLNQQVMTMFQLAFSKTRILPSDAKGVEGAETQRESKEEFLACLQNAAQQIESAANEAIRNYAAFKGMSDYEEEISLSDDITIEDVDQQLQIELAYWDKIRQYPKWEKEILKKRANAMNLTEIDEIIAEIESGPKVEENRVEERRELFKRAVNE